MPLKQSMAKLAARLLHADLVIYLDAGTSTLEIVPYIKALSGMAVVTSDFGIVQALIEAPNVTVTHTGGQLDHSNQSCVGGLAAANLHQVVTDIAFISTSSWDLRRGLTMPSALTWWPAVRSTVHSACTGSPGLSSLTSSSATMSCPLPRPMASASRVSNYYFHWTPPWPETGTRIRQSTRRIAIRLASVAAALMAIIIYPEKFVLISRPGHFPIRCDPNLGRSMSGKPTQSHRSSV